MPLKYRLCTNLAPLHDLSTYSVSKMEIENVGNSILRDVSAASLMHSCDCWEFDPLVIIGDDWLYWSTCIAVVIDCCVRRFISTWPLANKVSFLWTDGKHDQSERSRPIIARSRIPTSSGRWALVRVTSMATPAHRGKVDETV